MPAIHTPSSNATILRSRRQRRFTSLDRTATARFLPVSLIGIGKMWVVEDARLPRSASGLRGLFLCLDAGQPPDTHNGHDVRPSLLL